jgi:hypothetical protein
MIAYPQNRKVSEIEYWLLRYYQSKVVLMKPHIQINARTSCAQTSAARTGRTSVDRSWIGIT